MRQTLRVNRYMSLDTANPLARIVAFFHGGIRVLHTLRINNQEETFAKFLFPQQPKSNTGFRLFSFQITPNFTQIPP